MKKIILLISVITFAFTSCGSDDDSTAQDQFIGNWKYYKTFINDIEVDLDVCEAETTLAVSDNGTFTAKNYEDDFNGGCVLEGASSGTWKNLGNGMYSTTSDGDTYTLKVKFENNKMYVEEVDEGVVYTEVFIRQ